MRLFYVSVVSSGRLVWTVPSLSPNIDKLMEIDHRNLNKDEFLAPNPLWANGHYPKQWRWSSHLSRRSGDQRSFHAGTQKSDVNGHNPELSFLVTLGTWLAVLHLDMMIQPIRCSDPSCPFMTAYLLASRSSSTAALPFNVFAFFPFGSASFWIASSFFALIF